jgi:endonuclease III
MSPQIEERIDPGSYHDLHTVSNGACTDYSLGVKAARALVDRLASVDLSALAAMTYANAESVRAELDTMAARKNADPVYHAQCCVVFALISPQMDFGQNVELTRRVMDNLPRLDTLYSVGRAMKITKKDGTLGLFNGWKTKARTIHAALPFIQGLTPADMTRENLLALRGMAGKTSAMALALWDERSDVFTLDIWMFRLTREILGDDVAVKFSAGSLNAYKILESFWVAWAKTLGASIFEVQWTLWNCAGFGEHVSHLPIFGYDA